MPRDPRILLGDMLEAIEKIAGYTNQFDPQALDDPRTLDAVLRNLEVIGEAARGVAAEERAKLPSIEWRKIVGLRDLLIHQYFGVNTEIVADIVANKLAGLRETIATHLAK